jgi:hypothetical protein
MSDHRYDISRDLREASAMAKSLENYVHQDALYGSAGGGGFLSLSNMPSLTIGALVMRLRRLTLLHEQGKLDSKQRDALRTAQNAHDTVYTQHRKAYEEKLVREATSRLKAMQTFFEECAKDPKQCVRNYRPEANRRTIVQEILIRMDEIRMAVDDEIKTVQHTMDNRLRRYATDKTTFLLDAAIESAYPADVFWWLYQEPHTPEK